MEHDFQLALMTGIDIPIPELSLIIHQPTINDIAFMGEKNFFTAMQYFCINKESLIQDKSLLETLTNFQVIMKVLSQTKDKSKVNIMRTFLLILFPKCQSVILPSSIILSEKDKDPITIDDNNFETFQNYIKKILCVNSIFQGDNIVYNPANETAKKIADKLMWGRMKVAELKNKENKNNSILTRYVSILIVAKILNIDNCKNLTLFQLFDLMERFTAFIEWDTDLRVRLAGGKPEKTVESWMRDLYTQEIQTFNSSDTSSLIKTYK